MATRRRSKYPGLFKPVAVKRDPLTGTRSRIESPYWSGRFVDPATRKTGYRSPADREQG